MSEKELSDKPCDHPGWVRDPKGDYKCTKCGISVTDMFAEATRIPSVSKKEPTVTMSLKSWDNLDKDLSLAEHQMVSALTRVRVIRGQIYKSMKQCLKGRLDENLARVANLEELVKDLREVADEIKAKGKKEKENSDKDGEEETG